VDGRPALVACLGNPGPKYDLTWHNAGFWTADVLAREAGVAFVRAGLFATATLPGGVELAKPLTWMNGSGRAVSALLRLHDLSPSDLLVVCDDVSLTVGRLRLRAGGSAGGHNGLRSIISCLGTDSFPRLRLGIGPQPGGGDLADFVLSRVPAGLEEEASLMAHRAADCVGIACRDGLQAAMDLYNRIPPA
jgi:PTH1 family peptidyl-tRNA hydrolase